MKQITYDYLKWSEVKWFIQHYSNKTE